MAPKRRTRAVHFVARRVRQDVVADDAFFQPLFLDVIVADVPRGSVGGITNVPFTTTTKEDVVDVVVVDDVADVVVEAVVVVVLGVR